jgi:hypothetical protein
MCRKGASGNRGTIFFPETVAKMQNIIWGQSKPVKLIETPVWHGWKYRIGKGKRMLF